MNIFEADAYDEEFERNYLEDNGEEYNPDEEHWSLIDEMMETDFEDVIGQNGDYVDGKTAADRELNPNWGNTIVAGGVIGTWYGENTGFSTFRGMDDLMSGLDSPFKDCALFTFSIDDESGELNISAAHHDGSVSVDIRQLTSEGEEALEQFEEMDGIESFKEEIWNREDLCQPLHYAERVLGIEPEHEAQIAEAAEEER